MCRRSSKMPVVLRLLFAATLLQASFASSADSYLLNNVHILPMDSPRLLRNHSVLVEDGVITAIGISGLIDAPSEVEVVDGGGGFLMPGLSDMHAHIGGDADSYKPGTVTVAENQLLRYLATGVTLLRDTAGSPQHFEISTKLKNREWLGPDLYFTSPVLEGENAVWGEFTTKVLQADKAGKLVREYAEDGYWGVKVYHTVSAEVFDALISAGERSSIPIIGHVPFAVGIERALRAGIYSIEHLRGYDFDGMTLQALAADGGRSAERFLSLKRMSEQRMEQLVSLTLRHGVWNTPTLAINRFLFDQQSRAALSEHPRYPLVHPNIRHAVENASQLDSIFSEGARDALQQVLPRQKELVKRLYEAGAGVLIGTDAVVAAWVPGFTAIDEMQSIAEAGLSNYDVLKMATVDAARFMGISDERGTIAAGKQASFILLDGNPLESLDNLWGLRGVLHNKRWLTAAQMRLQLEQQAERFPPINK